MEAIIDTTNVEQAIEEERTLSPGAYDIRFYLTEPVGDSDLVSIVEHLSANGVDVVKVNQYKSSGLWVVSVKYRKPAERAAIGALPIAVIPLIAFGFIAVLVGIGIFNLESIANNIGKILLITFGGLALVVLAGRRPLEQAATAYASRR